MIVGYVLMVHLLLSAQKLKQNLQIHFTVRVMNVMFIILDSQILVSITEAKEVEVGVTEVNGVARIENHGEVIVALRNFLGKSFLMELILRELIVNRQDALESIYHWINECPEKERVKPEVTLITNDIVLCDEDLNVGESSLMSESLNCALLDSGASKNVCGEKWWNIYFESLSDVEENYVLTETSNNAFMFGDGTRVESLKKVTFPAVLGGHHINICTDVVQKDLPLWLSRDAMKKVEMNLDF